MPIRINHLSPYPDFLAFAITILLAVMLTFGVKESTRFNSIFTCVNILIVIYVVVCGSFKADIRNWSLKREEIPKDRSGGDGGFFPWGFSGMMAGAASCFYGFIGFDVIATTGEEALNPQKSIPISISLSLLLVFLAYFGVSAVQTLMWPYYDQDRDAPLPYIFQQVGWPVAKWVISIGALCGLSTSLLGAMFPLPRILYAMAQDGLIFRFLGSVNERFRTPLIATIISGFCAAFLAMIFDIVQLADMMSIGTLLAYSLVAISVLILRSVCSPCIFLCLCVSLCLVTCVAVKFCVLSSSYFMGDCLGCHGWINQLPLNGYSIEESLFLSPSLLFCTLSLRLSCYSCPM